MSVTLSVGNPINDVEKFYDLPVSTESGFRSVIEPIAEKHELTLIDWGTFSEVTKINLALFLEEIEIIREAILTLSDVSIQAKSHYFSRLGELAREAERLVKERPDIRLLIG
ncbi:hypothetical protein IV454_19880 [Massilia antarctica]|uniref:Uncharacterized protein n=1 Tax=Massilia antarctica TaxID=2765360 RepID=A0AA49A5V1_9BURK|nr:hypothetical protein [Massilia antarctica]QPI47823.1 hypothetical protein IV454_19880 [Massilia antarctica]